MKITLYLIDDKDYPENLILLGKTFTRAYEVAHHTTKEGEFLHIGKIDRPGTSKLTVPVIPTNSDIKKHMKYITDLYVSYQDTEIRAATDITLKPKEDTEVAIK